MSLLSTLGIGNAYAVAAPAAGHESGLMSMLPMLVIFVVVFYFLLIRPQSKRAKEHRELIGNLSQGDEIVTNGGVLGQISKMSEDFVVLRIAENVNITLQKGSITKILPKGTLESIS